MTSFRPVRGDVWFVDFGEPIGHEQGYRRPALIVSTDVYTRGPAGLAVVVPLTRHDKGVRWQVPVMPPEAGLSVASFIKCDDIRSVSVLRFGRHIGRVEARTMLQVENRLRILLEL